MSKGQRQRKSATFTVTLFYTSFFLGAMTYELLYNLEKEQYVLKAP